MGAKTTKWLHEFTVSRLQSGISVLSLPSARRPSPPVPPCQPHLALASLGVLGAARFGGSVELMCFIDFPPPLKLTIIWAEKHKRVILERNLCQG